MNVLSTIVSPLNFLRRSSEEEETNNFQKRTSTTCASQGLYVLPSAGQTVPSANDTVITWDSGCLTNGTSKIDIYLYAPESAKANLPIHAWTGVPASKGTYTVKLAPKWWNVTTDESSTTQLSLNIVNHGNEPWDSANPFGPTWNCTYVGSSDPPSDAVQSSSDEAKDLISAFYESGSLTAGGKAAAIICPLVVVGVALGVYIRKHHIKRNNKTADWAEHMDKRMSRISMDWMSGGDGSAGPVPGSRPASYYHPRPSGNFARRADDARSVNSQNFAGRGVQAAMAFHGIEDMEPEYIDETEMQEPRFRNASMHNAADRQSRISFAAETQGDRVSRISFVPSSADQSFSRGHKASASLPRVGANGRPQHSLDGGHRPTPSVPNLDGSYRLRDSNAYSIDGDENIEDDLSIMSPVQEQGPMPLGFSDVQNRMQGQGENGRNSMLDYPAVSMMHQDEKDEEHNHGHGGLSPMRAGAAGGQNSAPQGSSSATRPLYQGRAGLGHRQSASIHRSRTANSINSEINEDDVVGYNEANMF